MISLGKLIPAPPDAPWEDEWSPVIDCGSCRQAHPLSGVCDECGALLCAECNDLSKPCPVCGATVKVA